MFFLKIFNSYSSSDSCFVKETSSHYFLGIVKPESLVIVGISFKASEFDFFLKVAFAHHKSFNDLFGGLIVNKYFWILVVNSGHSLLLISLISCKADKRKCSLEYSVSFIVHHAEIGKISISLTFMKVAYRNLFWILYEDAESMRKIIVWLSIIDPIFQG